MKEQLKMFVDLFCETDRTKVTEVVKSPVQRHLREFNPRFYSLHTKIIQIFHTIVATFFMDHEKSKNRFRKFDWILMH